DPDTLGTTVVTTLNGGSIIGDPLTTDLYVATGSGILRVQNPTSASPTVTTFATGNIDGIAFTNDGLRIYAAVIPTSTVLGFDRTGAQVFSVDVSHPVDGIAVAQDNTFINTTNVSNNVFVNCNDGVIVRIDVNDGDAVSLVASGGSRGDLVTVGPDLCLYVTQTDRVVKLSPCFFQPSNPTPCGNGVVDPGEECDDGTGNNGAPGACCGGNCILRSASYTCRPAAGPCDIPETCDGTNPACPTDGFASSGTPCVEDSNFCTSDVCDGAGSCTHPYVPDPACLAPASGRGRLKVVAIAPPKLGQIQLKWKKGPLVQVGDFGNPSTGSPLYELCLYDAGVGGVYDGQPLGPCGSRPCWTSNAAGWKFKSTTGLPDGVTRMTLKGSPVAGNARVEAKAKMTSLLAAGLQLQTPVIAQVRSSDGHCWGARFSTPRQNVPGLFKAKSD